MDKREFKNYIDEIEKHRYYEPQKMIKLCHSLISQGKSSKDDCLRAYGEYYLLEGYYRIGKMDDTILRRALTTLQLTRSVNLHELESRCCNMMGICLTNQGDNITALEYYQKGLDIATKHRCTQMVRILTNNIGDLYLRLGECHTALSYLSKSYERAMSLYKKQDGTKKSKINVVTLNIGLLNIAEIYYQMNDYEKSLSFLGKLFSEKENGYDKEPYYSASVHAMYAKNYLKLNQSAKAQPYINKTITAAENGYEAVETVKDYQNVCDALIEYGYYEDAVRLLKAIKKIATELNFVNAWCDYYESAIKLSKVYNSDEPLMDLCEHYLTYKKMQDKSLQQQQLRALHNKQELNKAIHKQEVMEKRNQELQLMSEHDALTGLYNRYVLNRICDAWYKEAESKHSLLGVIALDVDFFKEYNDTYGHLQGDECLRDVSDALMEVANGDEVVARYGGDEFFILLREKTDEEILAYARRIGSNLREKKIRHDGSKVSQYVTLSMGIVNGTPEDSQTLMDLIHLADNALYKAKEEKRGSIGVRLSNGEYQVQQVQTASQTDN